jgi:hypothetical protein
MLRPLVLLPMVVAVPVAACDANPKQGPVGVAAVRECVRAAVRFAEGDAPRVIEGVPKLNALVGAAKGALRTATPDPTHTGSVVAYYLVLSDAATAERSVAAGREAVLEFRDRFESSVRAGAGYEMAVAVRNVLALYLEDPSGAKRQRDAIEDCIRSAS